MVTEEQLKKYIQNDTKAPKEFMCKKCMVPINGHNLYCHDGMCDECSFKMMGV